MVRHDEGSDPAAVIFDAIQAGKARNRDIIICDTAGRLHNKKNLMEELYAILGEENVFLACTPPKLEERNGNPGRNDAAHDERNPRSETL